MTGFTSNSERYLMYRKRSEPDAGLEPLALRAKSRCEHKLTLCLSCAPEWTIKNEIHWYRTVGGRRTAEALGVDDRFTGVVRPATDENVKHQYRPVTDEASSPYIWWDLDEMSEVNDLGSGHMYYDRTVIYGPWQKKILP